MSNEEYINFLKTVDKLPKEYYSIIREGILQINDDKKELFEIIDELKNRIDKAIEYIEQLEHNEWIMFGRKILLDILQGSDKE